MPPPPTDFQKVDYGAMESLWPSIHAESKVKLQMIDRVWNRFYGNFTREACKFSQPTKYACIESSLVISRWINQLLTTKNHTTNIPENLGQHGLDVKPVESESNFDLDKALSLVDRDRMDILDTLYV